MGMWARILRSYQSLPEKKRYIEFISALLTIPVLLTVVLLNVGNLRGAVKGEEEEKAEPSPIIATVIIEKEREEEEIASDNLTSPTPPSSLLPGPTGVSGTQVQCKREVGPVDIVYPQDRSLVSENPVCIDISYKQGEYCAVVWAYRINGSPWSEYTDHSLCLYDLPPGDKQLELRVKSVTGGEEVILPRQFTVKGSSPSPSSPPATLSATLR